MHNPVSIANYFIRLSNGNGFTLMQLLKLSYIAHGFKLAMLEEPLANERVEAWKFGPVFPSIYRCFKYCDPPGNKIREPIEWSNSTNFTDKEKEIIRSVCDIYGEIEGWRLSELTHKKGTPWYTTWHQESGRDSWGTKISDTDIKNHFKTSIINPASGN